MCVQRPEEARRAKCPGARVIGGCELPDVGAGKGTRVLWKNSNCSSLQNYLSRP